MANELNAEKNDVDYKSKEKQDLTMIIVLSLLALLILFTETMLVPALPSIAADFHAGSSDLAWVLTAYTLIGAVSIPIAGKMGDMYGRKRILPAIMGIFIISLIGGAIAWDLFSLIVFRGIGGVGISAIPLLMGMAKDSLPPRMVPIGIGLISAMFGVGAALGLVGGGVIVSSLGWQEAFWIVLPLVAIVVLLVHFIVPDRQTKVPTKMDGIGAGLLGVGLLTLLLALSRGEIWGWTSVQTIGLIAVAVVFFVAFAYRETKFDEPIMNPKLLKNRNISVAFATMFLLGTIMFMLYQTLPYFLELPQNDGGFGITDGIVIGLFMLPNAMAQLVVSPIAGKFGQKVGNGKIVIAGLIINALGLFMLAMLNSEEVGVLASVAVFGAGMGLSTVGINNMLASACTRENFGTANAVNTIFLTVGMSVGPVLASLVLEQFSDIATGYTYCWGIAAALGLLTMIFVLITKVGHDSDKALSVTREAQ